MEIVTVVFTNGNIVTFEAQELDMDVTMGNRNNVIRYPYKNALGEDSAIYLQPSEVAGVILTKATPGNPQGVTYQRPGS
jgi:acyl-CoA synthetase (AMP-forming)/AMP-acid ligase II